MYLVQVSEDKSTSKVLPSFLVEPLLNGQYETRKRGQFIEVKKSKTLTVLVKRHNL